MAQAAMSDVNLCASEAHSAYTTLAGGLEGGGGFAVRAAELRYRTALNQHAQSHQGHTAHANALLLLRPLKSTFYAAKQRAAQGSGIIIHQPLPESYSDMTVSFYSSENVVFVTSRF